MRHKCLVYLDDVIMHRQTLDEKLDNLEAVLGVIEGAGLRPKNGEVARCKKK